MRRTPVTLVSNVLLPNPVAAQFTAPAGTAPATGQPAASTWTISAFSLNNTDTASHQATIYIVPAGQTAGAANQIATTVNVPAAGAQPTQVPGLVGQHLLPGWSIQMLADVAAKVAALVSGYLTEL